MCYKFYDNFQRLRHESSRSGSTTRIGRCWQQGALRDYRSGARQNTIMKSMAAPLSERDLADLATYFASQPGGLIVVRQD